MGFSCPQPKHLLVNCGVTFSSVGIFAPHVWSDFKTLVIPCAIITHSAWTQIQEGENYTRGMKLEDSLGLYRAIV